MSKIITNKQLVISLKNNTINVLPVTLFNPLLTSSINAVTRYAFNLAGARFSSAIGISIEVTQGTATQTLTAPLITGSLDGIVDALNTLNIGSWARIDFNIYTRNDILRFDKLDILREGSGVIPDGFPYTFPLTFTS
jgi:hypothetical protein